MREFVCARPCGFHRLPRQSIAASADAAVEIRVAAFTAAERDVEAKENVIELTRNYHNSEDDCCGPAAE